MRDEREIARGEKEGQGKARGKEEKIRKRISEGKW